MVNQVFGRILRSERTASLGCPIVKRQRAANAEVIVNLKTVPILLLLGNVSQDRTQALVLDDRGLVHLCVPKLRFGVDAASGRRKLAS